MEVVAYNSAKVETFRDLNVYKKAYAASLEVYRLTRQFPAEEKYSITSQMRRCSQSICANLAEGFVKQRHSKAEFKRFISIAEGSASEMQVWLDYSKDFEFIARETYQHLASEYISISKMLNRLHQTATSTNHPKSNF